MGVIGISKGATFAYYKRGREYSRCTLEAYFRHD